MIVAHSKIMITFQWLAVLLLLILLNVVLVYVRPSWLDEDDDLYDENAPGRFTDPFGSTELTPGSSNQLYDNPTFTVTDEATSRH